MLTANQLTTAAHVLRVLADGRDTTDYAPAAREDWRRLARDFDDIASAGSGFGTPETLAAAVVLDNDRATAERRARIVRDFIARDYSDEQTRDDSEARRVVECADALAEYVEELAGFDGWSVETRAARTTHYLPDMAAALARAAFRNVDWIGLARHYVAEERLNPTTEPKR